MEKSITAATNVDGNNSSITMRGLIDKFGTGMILGLAAVFGLAAGFLQLGVIAFAIGVTGIAALVLLLHRSEQKPMDAGAWQRQIDREYRLSFDGINVTLYRNETVAEQFRWHGLIEVQLLSRRRAFPQSFWKLTTEDGDFLIPSGGGYAREFVKRHIYALPGYYEQRSVAVPAPKGYVRAYSMWRKDDPHPKQEVTYDWEW
jgi:hypothetical protein